jgi:hypothetical protein
MDKELFALRNNFRATKKFLIAKFDCSTISKQPGCPNQPRIDVSCYKYVPRCICSLICGDSLCLNVNMGSFFLQL